MSLFALKNMLHEIVVQTWMEKCLHTDYKIELIKVVHSKGFYAGHLCLKDLAINKFAAKEGGRSVKDWISCHLTAVLEVYKICSLVSQLSLANTDIKSRLYEKNGKHWLLLFDLLSVFSGFFTFLVQT